MQINLIMLYISKPSDAIQKETVFKYLKNIIEQDETRLSANRVHQLMSLSVNWDYFVPTMHNYALISSLNV